MTRVNGALCGLLLAVLTWTALGQTASFRYLDLDDDTYVTENTRIRDLTPGGLRRIFEPTHEDLYKPLTLLSFALEYHFFGLNPGVHHTTNLLLHYFNGLIVFALILWWRRSGWTAFWVAALFLVHPSRVESVAWISERKDVLYAFFYLWSLLLYARYLESGRRGFWRGSLASFLLSLLAKPMGVTLPLILIGMDIIQKRPLKRTAWLDKLPFVLLAVSFAGLTYFMAKYGRGAWIPPLMPRWASLFDASWALLFYLWTLIACVPMHIHYPHPKLIGGWTQLIYMLSPAIVLLILGIWWKCRRKYPSAFLGFGFFLLTLLPKLELIPTEPPSLVNHHYTYVPYIGLFLIAALFLEKGVPRHGAK